MDPEQTKQLEGWATQRDAILRDIAVLDGEKEIKTKQNKELGQSNQEIEIKVHQAEGRIIALEQEEEKRKNLVSVDILNLEKQKTILESSITALSGDVKDLILQKNDLIALIQFLSHTHKEVFDRTGILHEVIGHVVKVSQEHVSELETYFGSLKKNIKEIIDLNSSNVQETKIILEKLPLAILQFRRPVQVIRPVLNKLRGEEQLKAMGDAELPVE